jgi:hypothetical protein
MSDPITFTLDGAEVEAHPDETIWEVAKRLGIPLPHLCHRESRAIGPTATAAPAWSRSRASACWPASCPQADAGHGGYDRQRTRDHGAQNGDRTAAGRPAQARRRARSRLPAVALGRHDRRLRKPLSRATNAAEPDRQPPAIAVNLDACIHCTCACAPAARSRSTTSSAWPAAAPRQASSSTWTTHGRQHLRRLRRMRAGLPDRCADAGEPASTRPGTSARRALGGLLCPYCGVGCQTDLSTSRTTRSYVDGRDGPANENRLCVKGRFGFDYIHHPHRLTVPLIRRDDAPKTATSCARPGRTRLDPLPRGDLGRGAGPGRRRPQGDPRPHGAGRWPASARPRAPTRRPICSRSWSAGLRHQQRRPLHAAVPRLLGGGADGRHRLRRRDRTLHRARTPTCIIVIGANPARTTRWPRPFQERGQARRQADRHGSAPPADAPRHPHAAVQAGHRRRAAERHDHTSSSRKSSTTSNISGQHLRLRGLKEKVKASRRSAWRRSAAFRRDHPRPSRAPTPPRSVDHLLGHGHLAARARHRQCRAA